MKARNKRLIKLTEKPQGVTKFYGLTKKEVKKKI